jgi:integrase
VAAGDTQRGVPHLKVSGKGGKTRYLPLHPAASGLITDYLEAASHGGAEASPLFRPLHNIRDPAPGNAITPDGVYQMVREYSAQLGFEIGATFAPRDGRHQCPRSRSGHCQGSGMARTRQHRNHKDLRSAQNEARGFPDF